MCQPVVQIERLRFHYASGRLALDDVSLQVREQETVGLLGPNGAGKSTLLLFLAGLLPEPVPTQASAIAIRGLPVVEKNLAAVRRAVGLLFQDPDDQLFCTSVLADVAFGPRNLGMPLPEAKLAALRSLSAIGIEHLADRPPTQLSFGEKKLACLAGVLACEPSILALDEPTSNLDPRARRRFIQLLKSLPAAKLIATHDLDMAEELCDRVAVLDAGRIVAFGPTCTVLTDRRLLEAHGLEAPR